MKSVQFSVLVLILYDLLYQVVGEGQHLINSFHGSVSGGNYTYYKLMHRGYIRLQLDSTQCDADLYTSSFTSNPTFEDYEMKAATCGEDILDITPDVGRPVTIGVYGYSDCEIAKYLLHVMVVTNYKEEYPENDYDEFSAFDSQKRMNHKPHNKQAFNPGPKDEEESVIWTIFVGIMKILLDVLT